MEYLKPLREKKWCYPLKIYLRGWAQPTKNKKNKNILEFQTFEKDVWQLQRETSSRFRLAQQSNLFSVAFGSMEQYCKIMIFELMFGLQVAAKWNLSGKRSNLTLLSFQSIFKKF